MPVRELTRQQLPAELTTPIVAGQHLSVFIRVYPWFRLREYCASASGTVDYIDESCRAKGIISVPLWIGLLQWTKVLRHFVVNSQI